MTRPISDDEHDELVSVIEDAIFRNDTGLIAAVEAANALSERGWRRCEVTNS